MLDRHTLTAHLKAVNRPIEAARGLPSALYTSEAALALERQKIFFNGWACIGFGRDVPNCGDAKPVTFLGAPLLLLRDRDGVLRLFENTCRHRGMILVERAQNFGGVIRCPYHSWCYSTQGALKATPHVGGPGINTHASIKPENTGLTPVRMGVFMDIVFANISGTAESFEDFIAPLQARFSDFAQQSLYPADDATDVNGGFALTISANWKLILENNVESYHLPWVHPGLNAYSRLEDHYHLIEPYSYSGQGTLVYNPKLHETLALPNFPNLPEKWNTGAEYASLFPNVFISVHRDHYWAAMLDPLAHNQTCERVVMYYASQEAAKGAGFAALRAKNARLWKEVLTEDIMVTEGMQKGRGAPNFDGGIFSPVMDSPTHNFHKWVARRLGS
ncbi:MAG: aromatic ring-hydroxylating dioxygenase subunit alpha [Paracoccaceae bacterium]